MANLARPDERLRVAIVRAHEALEDGDDVFARGILLAALEVGGTESLPELLCPECRLDCHFHGPMEVHRLNVHGVELRDNGGELRAEAA